MTSQPAFSVVINTDGRRDHLRTTLQSLLYLDYPSYEVCVVHGPTQDGTPELLEEWRDSVKIACCPVRNLAVSRNIGIALAAAPFVAFIDDDSVPEAEWLNHLAAVYANDGVAGAGGIVYDHTGTSLQYLYATANRRGRADFGRTTPANDLNFPFSYNFPYLQGTNCSFRKNALLAVGGFDEAYDFYLDDTDLCCRLVDAGYLLRQLPNAAVHHRYLPSEIRGPNRVTRLWRSIIRNKLYFSIMNNHGHVSLDAAIRDTVEFIDERAFEIGEHIAQERLHPDDLQKFWEDVDIAWRDGLACGLRGERRLLEEATLRSWGRPYLEFLRRLPEGRRRSFCFISQEYPPRRTGGIGRYIHELAQAIAKLGHHVRILTVADEVDSVGFEGSVWVHRIATRNMQQCGYSDVPSRIWSHSAAMNAALEQIREQHPVDVVYAPLWDCEGVACLVAGMVPVVTGLQTTLHFWLESRAFMREDRSFMETFAAPMLKLERRILQQSHGLHAISSKILRDLERVYQVTVSPHRGAVIPLGLDDWATLPAVSPPSCASFSVRLLFVGRLEERKGIDVLLAAAAEVLGEAPHVYLDVVGSDRIPGKDGVSYRAKFERDMAGSPVLRQVCFHGEVDDAALRGFYRSCDVFVGPSRYESFGLVFLEAMMFSKPVIGCRAGAMPELIEEGETGLLADAGSVASLVGCLRELIGDRSRRIALGAAGRRRYETLYTADRMAAQMEKFLSRIAVMADRGTTALMDDLR